MQSAILKVLLIIVPILIFSCKKEDSEEPLSAQLQNTSWKYDKLVITEINGNNKLTIDLDTTVLSDETWTFKDHNRINVISHSDSEGCGEWIVKEQKLYISVALDKLIQEICQPENFGGYLHFFEPATIQNDSLILGEYNTVNRLYDSGDLNYEYYQVIMDDYTNRRIIIKTFFRPETTDVISNEECCGKVSWFFEK